MVFKMKKFFTFVLLICGMLILSVNTAMVYAEDFVIINDYLKEYNGTAENVIIPSTVTEIGMNAFSKNQSIESVVIPSSVKKIGHFAFESCYNLRSVEIQGAEVIGIGSFQECTSLTSVSLPSTLKIIYAAAFRYCSSLSQVSLPSSLELIGSGAFERTAISSAQIPANVSEIYDGAFPETATLTVMKGSFAEYWARENNYMRIAIDEGVVLPASISLNHTSVNMVVNDMFPLRAVLSPANVTNKAVVWTSSNYDVVRMVDSTDPETVVYAGDIVAVGPGTATITATALADNSVKSVCKVTVAPLTCPSSVIQADLPSDLKEIKASAFEGSGSLTEVRLPEGVKTIGNRAFADCRCLQRVYIPDSVTFIGEDAFLNDNGLMLVCESENYGMIYADQHNIDYRKGW